MAHIAIQHKVRDYATWKRIFDEFAATRKAGGELSFQIYHMDDDRNNIAVLLEWDTMDNAKAFLASDTLRDAMSNAGVESEPMIMFMNAGDSGKP